MQINAIRFILSENTFADKDKDKMKKTQHVLYFRNAGVSRISNMILRWGVAAKPKSQKVRKSEYQKSKKRHLRVMSKHILTNPTPRIALFVS